MIISDNKRVHTYYATGYRLDDFNTIVQSQNAWSFLLIFAEPRLNHFFYIFSVILQF